MRTTEHGRKMNERNEQDEKGGRKLSRKLERKYKQQKAGRKRKERVQGRIEDGEKESQTGKEMKGRRRRQERG